jgi:thioredoxin reductase
VRMRANCSAEEKDLVIIGGGVAGYVAAIKAGQAGMKVSEMATGIQWN